jgi:ceramide glucosyltransferase
LLTTIIAILLGCSLIYCLLMIVASLRYRPKADATATRQPTVPISVLKPLSGIDDGLRENLVSFFEQDYPQFELIFAVRHEHDPAHELVLSLVEQYPAVSSRILITGEPPYPNAKVYSLSLMTTAASYDLLVMSDSDIRVEKDFLKGISAEAYADRYDIATCPYRAVPGNTIWSRLEAIGMNTEFWGSALVAKLVEGVRFTIGPTVVARRKVLDAIPWPTLSGFLAEDFVLGQRAAELGFRVDLSQQVVEHRLSGDSMQKNFAHRLRWARSTRRSRPAGYIGQLFTYPLPTALILVALHHAYWPLLAGTIVLRALAAHAVSHLVLKGKLSVRNWLLIPLQDILGFAFWLAGFSGNHIDWRGRRYRLHRDGTFELVG